MRALLSVSDTTGLAEFARGLAELRWELVATDGTRAFLKSEGVDALSVEDVTGQAVLLGGRVKTLHPRIHAGILARRSDAQHRAELEREGIIPIDLVAANLYPFREAAAKGLAGTELMEKVDIGGVTLLRAAAKNHEDVIVVARPERYQGVLEELRERGSVDIGTRRDLAAEAYAHTASYDAAITSRLYAESGVSFPDELVLPMRKLRDLRYGENPHQQAAFYALRSESGPLTGMEQLHGKAPSFNNLIDLDAAWAIVSGFRQPTVAITKRCNPVGVSSDPDIVRAYRNAFRADSVSAYGSVLGVNRPVSMPLAHALADTFYEAIIGPGYEEGALDVLKRQDLEIFRAPLAKPGTKTHPLDLHRVAGGLLVQTPDDGVAEEGNFKPVTDRHPTLEELTDLIFAWRVVRHVTSSAIVLAKGLMTVGIGPGQVSRVAAVETAVRKAGENARLSVMASDAYFPFPDGIEVAARAGVTALIQPGGSVRDQMMIETADRYRIAMLFTGRRHFKH
ncbi:MAG: bifunctional phosphoribosylaminoimidazolecarboxamide formyltransferase/IMP cyclohydrolase [Chloroflexi bacterium]|nr:bifunctional phosphoribosylaminoimidazolecarboxamide formyltransferase/IMP cyclohydrolase [Chloroflexota bacterium]